MNFSKTTEYAFRILILMANGNKELYRAEEIFGELKIPYRYLRKQLTNLSKTGLIVSVQGKNGGYLISKSIEEISLLDIVIATGDDGIKNECFFGFEKCGNQEKCVMHEKWVSVRESIYNVLQTTNLSELKETGTSGFILGNSTLLTKND